MGSDSKKVEQNVNPVVINLGCGFKKYEGGINVDGFSACDPDILWNLNETPYPWNDNSVDIIYAYHVFEHLDNWWEAFRECARILKPGGQLEIRVPDPSSDSAVVYRDHVHVISLFSFDGIANRLKGRVLNSWAASQEIPPIVLIRYARVPFAEYNWIPIWILKYFAKHLRNYIWEQRFLFVKIEVNDWTKIEIKGHPKTEYLKLMRKPKVKKEIKGNGQ
jgi:SAM-dependent methyltransferase